MNIPRIINVLISEVYYGDYREKSLLPINMFIHINKHKNKRVQGARPGDYKAGGNSHAEEMLLGADVGGSHISAALVNASDGSIMEGTFCRSLVDPHTDSTAILLQWTGVLKEVLSKRPLHHLKGIGISMPGPFDYERGISHMDGVSKYNALFGINIRQVLSDELQLPPRLPVVFENDARCFGLGECLDGGAAGVERTIGITLGTGLGAVFLKQGNILTSGEGVAPGGYLYNIPFEKGRAEDLISARGILDTYQEMSGIGADNVKAIAIRALQGDTHALSAFNLFGVRLGRFLRPWLSRFSADCLVIGGSIARSHNLFLPALQQELEKEYVQVIISISEKMELSSIAGAAALAGRKNTEKNKEGEQANPWRLSALLPENVNGRNREPGAYTIYPSHAPEEGNLFPGFGSLARWMAEQQGVVLDGYAGIDWNAVREQCSIYFRQQNIHATWYEASAFLKPEAEIEALELSLMGKPDPTRKKKTTLLLEDLYDMGKLLRLRPDAPHTLNILIGTGAALCGWEAPVIYFDLPKNELQYRTGAGSVTSRGTAASRPPAEINKHFHFVDRGVLNEHRKKIKHRIAIVADGQWKDDLTWAHHDTVNK